MLLINKVHLNASLNEDLFLKHFFPSTCSIVTDFCYSLRYFLSIATDTVFFSALGAAYPVNLVYFHSVPSPGLCKRGQRTWFLSQCCPLVNYEIHTSTSTF